MTHPIFERHPIADEPVATSAGPQPTPYHVYDGHLVMVGGTAALAPVEALLARETVVPVRTTVGRTPMAMWIADEPQASHGAHGELQLSFYVSHEALPPLPASAFAIQRFVLEEPRARQMCHGLWNDTPEVVAYNREILGLDARIGEADFERADGRLRFAWRDPDGVPVASGELREGKRPTFGATRALFQSFGVRGALRAAAAKTVAVKVVNPVGEHLDRNADAYTISSPGDMAAHLFDPRRERIEIQAAPYAGLDFQPDFVQHMRGFNFVYLPPE